MIKRLAVHVVSFAHFRWLVLIMLFTVQAQILTFLGGIFAEVYGALDDNRRGSHMDRGQCEISVTPDESVSLASKSRGW